MPDHTGSQVMRRRAQCMAQSVPQSPEASNLSPLPCAERMQSVTLTELCCYARCVFTAFSCATVCVRSMQIWRQRMATHVPADRGPAIPHPAVVRHVQVRRFSQSLYSPVPASNCAPRASLTCFDDLVLFAATCPSVSATGSRAGDGNAHAAARRGTATGCCGAVMDCCGAAGLAGLAGLDGGTHA